MPTELLEPEERALEQQIRECERYLSGEAFRGNLGEPPPRHQHRAALMLEALVDQWHRLRDAPFQVRATLASSVFGNVGTTISFRLGRDDAEQFARLFDPYFAPGLLPSEQGPRIRRAVRKLLAFRRIPARYGEEDLAENLETLAYA